MDGVRFDCKVSHCKPTFYPVIEGNSSSKMMNSTGKLAGRTSAIVKKQNITDRQQSKNLAQRKTKFSFVCFLVWAFVLIARPQDYLTFLMPLRPVISMTVLTLVFMLIERTRVPREIVKLQRSPLYTLVLCYHGYRNTLCCSPGGCIQLSFHNISVNVDLFFR